MASAPKRQWRYRYRLMAAMVLVSLPLMIVLSALLTSEAASGLTAANLHEEAKTAESVALRVEDWLVERQDNLRHLAEATSDQLQSPTLAGDLADVAKTYGVYSLIEVTDLTGAVLASSSPATSVEVVGRDWFATAARRVSRWSRRRCSAATGWNG